MSVGPEGRDSLRVGIAIAVVVFVIATMAVMSHSHRQWEAMAREAMALTDGLAESRRMVLLAELHAEKLIQGDTASSPDLVAVTLDRAVAASQALLRGGAGRTSGSDARELPEALRAAIEEHVVRIEQSAAGLRTRLRAPFSVDGLDLRHLMLSLDESAVSVEAGVREHLAAQRRHLHRVDAGAIALVGLLALAMFVLLTVASRRRDRAVADLREREARLAAFARGLPGLGFMIDSQGRYLAIHGRDTADAARPEGGLLQRRLADVLPAEVAAAGMEVIERVLRTGETLTHEYRLLLNGRQRSFEARVAPVGSTGSVVWLASDVSARKEAEQRVSLLAAALEGSREGVIITDLEGRVVMANRAFTDLTGFSEPEIVGRSPRLLRSPLHDDAFYRSLAGALLRDGHWQGEAWLSGKDGVALPLFMNVSAVPDAAGAAGHYVVAMTDLRQLKQAQARLETMLTVDPLTSLPNLASMRMRIDRALAGAAGGAGSVAVLFIDLDAFRVVNDGLGHVLGDELLVAVARRLQDRLRGRDTLGRRGGDEFVALLEGLSAPGDAARIAEALRESLDQPFALSSGDEVFVRASVGIALHPHDGASGDELLRNAETALHQVKREALGRHRFYSATLTAAAGERLALERRLRRALHAEAFELRYQPIIELEGGRLRGVEALVRMKPDGEPPIGPAAFIPVMEETGMILALGKWVQRAACAQARAWLDEGLEFGFVAVNMSAAEIRGGGVESQLRRILGEARLPPERLELEISESGLMSRGSGAEDFLHRLKAVGVKLAIDDFGTGYSSLAYLKRFPVEKLKIDRSFVRGIPDDRDDVQLVTTIVALARNLGLRVVAEGVETGRQRDFLRSVGCHAYQGYLGSRPLPADEFAERFLGAPVSR